MKYMSLLCGDKNHPRAKDSYEKLDSLVEEMKAAGYKPEKSSMLHSMDDADAEFSLCGHSEKLAIEFGLISTPAKTTLRFVQNFRVCVDCHNATKFIVERNIIVRDANRIHSFKDGVCSCGNGRNGFHWNTLPRLKLFGAIWIRMRVGNLG